MKTLLLFSVFATSSFAVPPNFFECMGKGIKVRYFQGKDQATSELVISIKEQKESVRQGKGIQTFNSPIGTFVSIEQSFFPEGESSYEAILIPEMNLAEGKNVMEFLTTFITYSHKGNKAGPEAIDGLITEVQDYKMMYCVGTLK